MKRTRTLTKVAMTSRETSDLVVGRDHAGVGDVHARDAEGMSARDLTVKRDKRSLIDLVERAGAAD